MKKITFIILLTSCLFKAKASPQAPDFLVIGQDTIAIYFEPLNRLDSIRKTTFFGNLQAGNKEFGFALNLYRGYQALWKLESNKLFLVGLKGNPHSDRILQSTFGKDYENGKVLANWFSSYLAIPKGKLLKWDGVFSRTYLKEEILEFKNGILIDRKLAENYVRVKNGISRIKDNKKYIADKMLQKIRKLDWKKLSDCDCDDKYFITINAAGKVGRIELIPYTDNVDTARMEIESHRICIEKFNSKLKELQFDILKWNGKPYEEKYLLELFYSGEGKLENWTN